MRKYISILCLMLLTVFSVQAANKNDSTEFKGHWTLQVQGGVSHTVGEAAFGELISPAAAISFGYQFTPVWGLRAGLSGWQGKGAVVYPEQTYKFNYLQGNVDVMVDIVSIFDGYRAKRLFNPYLFAGFFAVIQSDPSCSGLQPPPASCGALTRLHLNNGKYPDAGKLASSGMVCPWSRPDIQICDTDLHKEGYIRC